MVLAPYEFIKMACAFFISFYIISFARDDGECYYDNDFCLHIVVKRIYIKNMSGPENFGSAFINESEGIDSNDSKQEVEKRKGYERIEGELSPDDWDEICSFFWQKKNLNRYLYVINALQAESDGATLVDVKLADRIRSESETVRLTKRIRPNVIVSSINNLWNIADFPFRIYKVNDRQKFSQYKIYRVVRKE